MVTAIECDIDFILKKTDQLFKIVENKQYHLIESKEVIRKQLIEQFFINYPPEEILSVNDKLDKLIKLSALLTKECEVLLQFTKNNILKVKQSDKVIKAYK